MVSYSSASGILTLQHQHPRDTGVEALVDVTLILESIKSEHVRVGEWVNIIGYISAIAHPSPAKPSNQVRSEVHIQAMLLWSAAALDIQEYERTLSALTGEHNDMAREGPSDHLLQLRGRPGIPSSLGTVQH